MTSHTMTIKEACTPSYRTPSVCSSRKRRRRDSDEEDNFDLTVGSCNFQNCDTENIEMKDFSTAKKTYPVPAGLSNTFISPMQRLTPFTSPLVTNGAKAGVSSHLTFPFSPGEVSSDRVSQGKRRSVRIAKRRSVCREGIPQGALPSLSVLSPVSVCCMFMYVL